MEPLPLIPTPPAQRWQEIKLRVVPFAVFLLTLLATFWTWSNYVIPPSLLGQVEVRQANLTSAKPGALVQLNLDLFQEVKAGDQ